MGECVECTNNGDCESPTSPVCIDGNTCGCEDNDDCDGLYPDCIDGQCAQPCTQDGYEDNNLYSQATDLDEPQDDLDDLWICPAEVDWFEFTLNGVFFVSIITNSDAGHGNIHMQLFDGGLNLLNSSSGSKYVPRTVQAIHTTLAPVAGPTETFYIRIQAAEGTGGIPYRLTVITLPKG